MNFSNVIKVRRPADEAAMAELRNTVEQEMRRVADSVRATRKEVLVEGVNNTFGSILRNDRTSIRIKPSRKGDGIVAEADTVYNPSAWFWVFLVIDILLIETVIGFVVGMALTLGLYFHNKNLVQNAVRQALENAARSVE